LGEYAEDVVQRADLRALAGKVSYIVDPKNPYPKQFTGHLRITLKNGEVHEHSQGYFKGGVDHPMSDADLQQKFLANCRYGKVSDVQAQALLSQWGSVFGAGTVDLSALALVA
jgi:2-methylcitrate dehydratase PrpD